VRPTDWLLQQQRGVFAVHLIEARRLERHEEREQFFVVNRSTSGIVYLRFGPAGPANSDFALSRGFGGFCARTQALRNTLSSLRGIRVRFVGERAAGRESNAANVGFSVL